MTNYNTEVKGKVIWGAADRPRLCRREEVGWHRVQKPSDAAPRRPAQTQ